MAVLNEFFSRHGASIYVMTRQHILELFVPEKSVLNEIFVPCVSVVRGIAPYNDQAYESRTTFESNELVSNKLIIFVIQQLLL